MKALICLIIVWSSLCYCVLSGWLSCRDGAGCTAPIANVPQRLSTIYKNTNSRYDKSFPPKHLQLSTLSQLKPTFLRNRCQLQKPGEAFRAYHNHLKVDTKDKGKKENIMIQSPCFSDDSLGNMLSHYFETLACAVEAGATFMSVAKVFSPKTRDELIHEPFIKALPEVVLTRDDWEVEQADLEASSLYVASQCRCYENCHENPKSRWPHHVPLIRSVLTNAIEGFLNERKKSTNSTEFTIGKGSLSTRPSTTPLPLIPTVAVHYRCGDNFVGPYGFVVFKAISARIRSYLNSPGRGDGAFTIYILAEDRERKTEGPWKLAGKCDKILSLLFQHLAQQFPNAEAVVLERGGNIHLDLSRLALAPVTICSISTFCLWPALTNVHRKNVYIPQSNLFLKGGLYTGVDFEFSWIPRNETVLGAPFTTQHTNKLLAVLQ